MGRPKINLGPCKLCEKPAWTKGLCAAHYKKDYYLNNIDTESENRRLHNLKNRAKIAKRKREREKTDLNYKLANRLRHRLNSAIKGGGSIVYLGCSLDELKKHLESQFDIGMDWSNHTSYGWHIDHIVPLASLDLTIEDNLKKVCHYTNLRPMWWQENLKRNHDDS